MENFQKLLFEHGLTITVAVIYTVVILVLYHLFLIRKLAGPGRLALQKPANLTERETEKSPAAPALKEIFFATNRNFHPDEKQGFWFGNVESKLSYGRSQVSSVIPGIDGGQIRPGEAKSDVNGQSPFTFYGFSLFGPDTFYTTLKIKGSSITNKTALIYIHGYSASFIDAAVTAAKIQSGLDFRGRIVFYSWPSQGNFREYYNDLQAIESAQDDITEFLNCFLKESSADEIFIIAESLGCRAIANAITRIARHNLVGTQVIKELILIVPDIDNEVFSNQIAHSLVKSVGRVTMYVSATNPLQLMAKQIHGKRRAGDSMQGTALTEGVDTIDMTSTNTGFLNDYMEDGNPAILSDIRNLISTGLPPDQRPGLTRVKTKPLPYWLLK